MMLKKYASVFVICLLFVLGACSHSEDPSDNPHNPNQGVPKKYNYVPQINIRTNGMQPIVSKEDYLNAVITIEERDSLGKVVEKSFEGTTEIRGRGNTTWGLPKKPYRIKLKEKSALLGMPANKHWVLLANYPDKTLMRNELAFEVSRRMGFAYTVHSQYVDLYLNNKYDGNYMLCEQIRIGADRVDISELKPTSKNNTGGYLLELDERKGDPYWFQTQKARMIFCVNTPEDITPEQLTYIKNHVQKVENILYGVDGVNVVQELPKYLDMKSFVDYYLLNELSKSVDGNLRLSTYIYKKQDDDKLYFGPVWDYDIAFGNVNHDGGQDPSGWMVRKAAWYGKFFAHPEFDKMVKDRWRELRGGQLSTLHPFINEQMTKIWKSQESNFYRWEILTIQVWPYPTVKGSYLGEVSYLKEWLSSRLEWMDSELQ